MKIVKTYNSEHLIEDDELKAILENAGCEGLFELRSGEYVRPKSIIAITGPELVPFWNGYILSKDGRSFVRDGERIYIENFNEVEYLPHPKYKNLEEIAKERKQIGKNKTNLIK